jgi:glutamyl-tRNA(Gln) amidotransferase subunit D
VKTLQVESITGTVPSRDKDRKPVVTTQFDHRAALIKFYPGFDPWTIETIVSNGIRGIILEGTGLGHVSKNCYPAIKKTIKENIPIFMTSQTIWGRVDMNVYYTGRDLLALGVTPLDDMLSETALVKLMWTLPQTRSIDEIRNLMLKPIAGDMSDRTTIREEQAVVAG